MNAIYAFAVLFLLGITLAIAVSTVGVAYLGEAIRIFIIIALVLAVGLAWES